MSDADREREALRRALGPAARRLDAWEAPEPPAPLVHTTLRRAADAMRAEAAADEAAAARPSEPARAAARLWPVGFRRELARLLAAALVPGAAVLAFQVAVLLHAPALLARWLPESLAFALPAAWALAALGWLSVVVGSLPFLAHRRAGARLRPREVPA